LTQRSVIQNGRHSSKSVVSTGRKPSPYIDLRDLSSREIKGIAEKAAKKEGLVEFNRPRVSPSSGQKIGTLLMSRLSIPVEKIAPRLKINRKTAKKYSENKSLIPSIKKSLNKGLACHRVAEKHGCPAPLVWSIALEGKPTRNILRH
jgi:hypothetical protein